MKRISLRIGVFLIIILLTTTIIPISAVETDYYSDSFILIIGLCNTVDQPLMWGLGFYLPIIRKNFYIATNNETGEMISIFVKNNQNALLLSQETASIRMNGARGVFFWGKTSLLLANSSVLFVMGRARDIWITH